MASGIKYFRSQIDVGSNKISNLAAGTLGTDAVNVGQMQSYAAGVSHFDETRAASTTNVTLTAPGATIDGVTLVANDRVLLKNQTTQSQNGIYVWTASGSALTRATDSNTQSLVIGQVVTVTEGTANKDTSWIQNVTGAITIDTTALVFVPFAAGATYTGANGVTVSGTSITGAVVAGGGLSVGAGGFQIDHSKTPQIYTTTVGDGTSTNFTVTHNLGTRHVIVRVWDSAAFDDIEVDVVRTSTTVVTINVLGTAPTTNQLSVTIFG